MSPETNDSEKWRHWSTRDSAPMENSSEQFLPRTGFQFLGSICSQSYFCNWTNKNGFENDRGRCGVVWVGFLLVFLIAVIIVQMPTQTELAKDVF